MQQQLKKMHGDLVAGTFSTEGLGIRIALVAMAGFGAVLACGTIPGYVEPIIDEATQTVIVKGHWMEKPQIAVRWIGVAMAVLGAIVQKRNGTAPS